MTRAAAMAAAWYGSPLAPAKLSEFLFGAQGNVVSAASWSGWSWRRRTLRVAVPATTRIHLLTETTHMSPRTSLSVLASLTLLGVVVAPPLHAQGPATVVVVIDDTQVRPGDGPRVGELIDRLEQDVLDARTAFGIATVGPAGLNVDLTKDRRQLREAGAAARAGHLDFTLPPSPDKAADALVATLKGVVGGVVKRAGPKAVIVIGRATPVAEKRHAKWLALQRDADSAAVVWAWFELGERCQTSGPATDASLVAKPAACAAMADAAGSRTVLQVLASLVRR